MALSNATKAVIVQAARELMRQRSLDAITVEMIAGACHISRNTFYYHFEDKYDMLRWMFQQQIQPALDAACARGPWADSIPVLCEWLRQDARLSLHLMQTLAPESLPGLLLDYYKEAILRSARDYFSRRKTDDEEAEAVALYYAYGVVGSLMEWVRRGMRTDPCQIRRTIQGIVQEQAFRR